MTTKEPAKPGPKTRKPRNNVSEESQKVSENVGLDSDIVKSEESAPQKLHGNCIQGEEKQQMMEGILLRIAQGEPLRQICRDEKMPGWVTVYSWIDSDPNFSERFARARDKGEDAIAQECLDIADNASNDWMEYYDKEGESLGWKLNGDHVQRSKLRIETRLKLLAKWNPKKWGEKLAVGGAADLPPIKNMSDSELEAKIAERLAALKG